MTAFATQDGPMLTSQRLGARATPLYVPLGTLELLARFRLSSAAFVYAQV